MCSYYENGYLTADTIDGYECYVYSITEMLFDHDFAKAFWGTKKDSIYNEVDVGYWADDETPACFYGEVWKFHLSKMVLEEEPLKYLEKFL